MGYRRMFVCGVALSVIALVAPASALPIPGGSAGPRAPSFVGDQSTASPITASPVPQNPYLAPNGSNNMHDDPYATDAYTGSGPIGRNTKTTSLLLGVEECATVAFDSAGRLVGLCVQTLGPVLRLMDPTTMAVKATYRLPGRDLTSGANPLSDLCGGAYFYLDNLNRAVVATTTGQIRIVADTGTAFALQHTFDLSSYLPNKDCLIALMPDWSGRIWFATHAGGVGTVNPVTGAVHIMHMPGEIIANSVAADETGGVFVVSDHALYRFDADNAGAPIVTWRQAYDRGSG